VGVIDWLFGKKTTPPGPASPGAPIARAASKPPKCPGNPGVTAAGRIAFSNSERTWTEEFQLVPIVAGVLRSRGHEVVQHESWLELRQSGFVLQPLIVQLEPLDKGGVRTVTTMDVRHADLITDGLFKYQHATGDDVVKSLAQGFESWESIDLPVLLDALRARPEKCTLWEMNFPAKDGLPARVRRAVLGSVACYAANPPPADKTADESAGGCEHAFCNCCFLTRNFEAFRAQLEGDGCVGIRFYAMRDEDGTPAADCRINGEDYEPGMQALRCYVATWPGHGFEFRKQYVLLHTSGRESP